MENKGFDREAMRITIDYNNMMQETLGERGLTRVSCIMLL